jgi:hypothetical protein
MFSAAWRSTRNVSSTCASQASRSALVFRLFLFFPIVASEQPLYLTHFFQDIVQREERRRKFVMRNKWFRIDAKASITTSDTTRRRSRHGR